MSAFDPKQTFAHLPGPVRVYLGCTGLAERPVKFVFEALGGFRQSHIMPPMPPMSPIPGGKAASSFFGASATPASVVTSRPATEAAS